jgi:hypothetical protein
LIGSLFRGHGCACPNALPKHIESEGVRYMVGTDNSDRPKLTISIPAQPVDSAAWTGRDIPPMPGSGRRHAAFR